MQEPLESRIDIGDVELCLYEWPGAGDPVLLLHATGFHSRCWNEVVLRLPGKQVFAVDIHFHGGSSDAGEMVDWGLFSRDICRLIERLDLRNIVGVGHSMGGHLVARSAATLPQRFRQLVLIDPVIFAPQLYADLTALTGDIQARDHPVASRKNNWRDAEEMFERFRDRPPFDSWQPEVLRDYCDYALLPPDEEGIRQLACNPINEASNYLNHRDNGVILDLLPRIGMPVTLLRAPTSNNLAGDFSASPTWPELASALPLCRDIYLPGHNHFIPMQDPALVARYISAALEDRWQEAGG
jgi:pimeloyl-ACP methyl ester carboxylesterase